MSYKAKRSVPIGNIYSFFLPVYAAWNCIILKGPDLFPYSFIMYASLLFSSPDSFYISEFP